MSAPSKMDKHLDIRVSAEHLAKFRQRMPAGTKMTEWARATLLAEPVQRRRVVRRKIYRDTTPYAERVQMDGLLSIATILGRLARGAFTEETQCEIRKLLGQVRGEILKGKASC